MVGCRTSSNLKRVVFAWHCTNCDVKGQSEENVCWNCGEEPTVTAKPTIDVQPTTTVQKFSQNPGDSN